MILFIAFFFLASAITSNKVILYALSPEYLVGIRMTIAALLLVGYSYFQVHHRLVWSQVRRYFFWLCGIALFTTFLPSNLKAYALAHMPSSKMAFFGTLDPFIAALYASILFKERLTPQKWLGMLIGFSGMMVLVVATSPVEATAFWVVSYPELAAIAAFFISTFGWILVQDFLKKGLFDPVQINSITMFIGGIVSLGIAFMRQQTIIASLSQAPLTILQEGPLSYFSSTNQLLFFLAYTIIIGNMLGYTIYSYALKKYSATFIALVGFSIPLMVHFFGWLFLNEKLSLTFFISCLITFIGVLVFFFDERKEVS